MFPTVAEVLELDQVRQGHPEVVAGAENLQRAVRWAHVSELADIAGLLRGGELILTTGVALPADDADLAAYVADLDDVGAAGLVVELGRRYAGALPPALVRAAQGRGLPLVALHRQTRFVSITEAVHALVVDAQVAELRATAQVHQTFTELSVEGAEPAEVVRQAAQMAGGPVVLENLAHQVLAYDSAGGDAADLLDGWETRSRSVELSERTGYDERTGWVVTVVGARGHDWGRLVLVLDGPPGRARADAGRTVRVHPRAEPAGRAGPGEPGTAEPPHPARRDPGPHLAGRRGGAARAGAGRAAGRSPPGRRGGATAGTTG